MALSAVLFPVSVLPERHRRLAAQLLQDRAPHGRRRGQRHAHPVFPGRTGGPYALTAGV